MRREIFSCSGPCRCLPHVAPIRDEEGDAGVFDETGWVASGRSPRCNYGTRGTRSEGRRRRPLALLGELRPSAHTAWVKPFRDLGHRTTDCENLANCTLLAGWAI
jgi:hypothetical protein